MMQILDRDLEAPWVGQSPWDYMNDFGYEDEPGYCELCGEKIDDDNDHFACVI